MSNLFESLQKAELIGADEFPLPSSTLVLERGWEEPALEQPVIEQSFSPADVGPLTFRSAKLRVSALSPVFPFDQSNHAAAEQYRIIRTKVLHHPQRPRLLVVSSAGSGDGKTITSINLAASFALKSDARVALIDADMRRPQIANLLGLDKSPGLGEVLSGAATFSEAAVSPEDIPNLCILTAGSAKDRAAELLESARWRSLVTLLRQHFDYVIFDATPVSAVADYELVQLACDGVVMVARPDHSERKAVERSLQTVQKDKLLGVVLNCVDNWFLWRTHTYDYYSKA